MLRFLIILSVATGSVAAALGEEADLRLDRGKALAVGLCGECHALGSGQEQSPHVGAPPFRRLDERLDLDFFVRRLREGLTSGHPDMPTFRFNRQDADALVAFLRSVQAP
jgi:mono/diheme cytochrome c family protein